MGQGGAGRGNRTRILSLEGWYLTIRSGPQKSEHRPQGRTPCRSHSSTHMSKLVCVQYVPRVYLVRGIASRLVGSPATPHIGCDCSRCTIRFSAFWVNRTELTCRIRGVTNTTRNSGGDGRIRTYALLRPALQAGAIDQLGHISKIKMARLERFELSTPWFVARYSIQMSYRRGKRMEPRAEIESATRWLGTIRSIH